MAVSLEECAIIVFRGMCCAVIVATLRTLSRRSSIPGIPGPWSLPVIGSLPFLGLRLHLSLTKLQKRYGDVFQIRVGSQPIVVLCGLNTLRSALVDQASVFSGRPKLLTFQLASSGKSMSFNSYSQQWKSHRRLAEQALRMASIGQPAVEAMMVKEARALGRHCLQSCRASSCGLDPDHAILWSVAHVNYTLCYGDSRLDSDFETMVTSTKALIECHMRGNALNFFPWAKLPFFLHYRSLRQTCSTMLCLTQRKEDHHLATYDQTQCRDVLDALICLGLRRGCPLEREQVLHTVQEYITAGLDIVYTALTWVVLYLATYPNVQQRVAAEVDKVIGRSGCPKKSHVQAMPYTQAFILEVLRHSSLVPFALPHSTLSSTSINGIHIPKDTFVLINLYSISRDPDLWPDPELFNPERFLQADHANFMEKPEGFYPFGLGRRRCLGEQLSRVEIFLYITCLLQTATIEKPPHVKEYNLQPKFGIVLRPQPYQVVFKPR